MTVNELIAALQMLPGDAKIFTFEGLSVDGVSMHDGHAVVY